MTEILGMLVAFAWVVAIVLALVWYAARRRRTGRGGIVAGGLPWWHVGGQPAGGQPEDVRSEQRR